MAAPDDTPRAVPYLNDDVLSEIAHRLPTKDAYRLAAVSRRWGALVNSSLFLSRYLFPRPGPDDDLPDALILQPKKTLGYTYLVLVATDPAVRVALNLPVHRKYAGMGFEARAPEGLWSGLNLNPPPRPPPVPELKLGDHAVAFFERTVPALNISVVASHGRLLLCRSPSRYFVCDPAANRWLAPPPPTSIPPTRGTAAGIHYDVDAATGSISFTVVLLARARRRRVLVETFSSATGRWVTRVLGAQGVARCLGPASVGGIRVGACFYWLSRLRGRIVRYDAASGRATVVREPPTVVEWVDHYVVRTGRSLGSVGGQLRFCAFDIRDVSYHNFPLRHLDGVLGVWTLDSAGVAGWRRVHETMVHGLLSFTLLNTKETPLDFAGAPGGSIIVDKNHTLFRHDLDTRGKVKLMELYGFSGSLSDLYDSPFRVFPFYRAQNVQMEQLALAVDTPAAEAYDRHQVLSDTGLPGDELDVIEPLFSADPAEHADPAVEDE